MPGIAADAHSIFSAELERVPLRVRLFLGRERQPSSYAKTWENFAGAYHDAFEIMVDAAMTKDARGRLTLPLLYMCRHTLELDIKNAIIVYSESAAVPPDVKGHSLARLWNELMRQIELAGFEINDEWTVHCGKLVDHIHQIDPDGERFRYPSSTSGTEFDQTSVDITGLAVAQWHIGMLCDGVIGMLDALGRKPSV
jgi:hypothetical protein